MSVYFVKGKGHRYDFTLNGTRHTAAWFKTKREAKQAEARKREELENPKPEEETQTDITFLELINLRLDFLAAYKTRSYYDDSRYVFKRLASRWGSMAVSEISNGMIQSYILERAEESHYAANYDLRVLKALFNHGLKDGCLSFNPVTGIPFLPVEKKAKYIPTAEEIDKMISVADKDTQDYLWAIRETMARVSEINTLTWDDVNLPEKYVILYTRKKKGGHLTPRKVPMTNRLFQVLSRRFAERDESKPWVFWHRYWGRKTHRWEEGPFQDRKKIMKNLCEKAGVKYFRFHALRHSSASVMDNSNVPIGTIQRILGHENRTTTEIYLHGLHDAEREAISTYERARSNSHTDSHTN